MLGGVITNSRFSKTTRPQNKKYLTSIPLKGDFIMYGRQERAHVRVKCRQLLVRQRCAQRREYALLPPGATQQGKRRPGVLRSGSRWHGRGRRVRHRGALLLWQRWPRCRFGSPRSSPSRVRCTCAGAGTVNVSLRVGARVGGSILSTRWVPAVCGPMVQRTSAGQAALRGHQGCGVRRCAPGASQPRLYTCRRGR